MILERRPWTQALAAMLETGSGKKVGIEKSPSGARIEDGWYVLHAIPGGSFAGGAFADVDEDAEMVYQIDGIGARYDHAEWLADRARQVMLSRATLGFQVDLPPPAGWKVMDRQPETGPSAPIGEGTEPNRVFTAAERYRIFVTPA